MNNDYTPTRPEGFDYDAALADLQEKIRRKKKAKTMLAHFAEEAERLNSVMEDRKAEYETEQEEADALQGASLTLLLYTLMGLKEEKISKEESEALMAKAEYETAKAELDHVLGRQVELRAEIRALGNCERDYEEMVAEKKAWLMKHEATVNAEVEALETEKAAIISGAKELKEAMESGQYVLKVAHSVVDAFETYLTYLGEASRRNRHTSPYRDHDISMEIRNSRIREENSLETLGRYLQDFAAELKDLIGQPEQVIPAARIEEALTWISQWVKNVTTKHHGGSHGVSPILGELTPLVCELEHKYAEKEAACREIDERIRAMVLDRT
ncbi:MAG: hypothetical protein IJX72_07850 [Clostridia bacterium]|nr:hypothetical protein [Clostridia bacterium]